MRLRKRDTIRDDVAEDWTDAEPGLTDFGRAADLPRRTASRRLLLPDHVAESTRVVLRGHGGSDGRHEGMVFWAGRRSDNDDLVTTVVVPQSVHGRGYVHASAAAVGAAARQARALRLALLAQVHSHPGTWTRHSDGDDRMVMMPYEGMFSIVVGRYGDDGVLPSQGASWHQFRNGEWVMVTNAAEAVILLPPVVWP